MPSREEVLDADMTSVLVMNPYYSGVAIARLLAPRGVPVYALYTDPLASGRHSRHFAGEFAVPDGGTDPDGLVNTLLDLTKRLACRAVIFPTRDLDVAFLRANRRRLEGALVISLAENSAHEALSDKGRLADLAAAHGVKYPLTSEVATEGDVRSVGERFAFPVVMKPVHAYEWRSEAGKGASQSRKAIIAANVEGLLVEYRAVAHVTPRVVVQEFVPGPDDDLVVCGCYVDRTGRLAGAFTARKLLQSPPSAGTGCLITLDDIPDIVAPTADMLRSVGYFGIAEAEYKYDHRDGRYALIEINLRHWDQHELGTLAGVDVTWLAYCEALGRPLGEQQLARQGAAGTWVAERELVDLLLRRVLGVVSGRRGESGQRRRANRPLMFGVWRLKDPIPGLILMWRTLSDLTGRAFRRLQSPLGARKR
jgi:predicted ATP-grasp superfamily ATP-dependent carboligase